jgi:hypothetical protein
LENVGELDRAIEILDAKLNNMDKSDLYEVYLEKEILLLEKKQKINGEYISLAQKEILSILPIDLISKIEDSFSKFNDLST